MASKKEQSNPGAPSEVGVLPLLTKTVETKAGTVSPPEINSKAKEEKKEVKEEKPQADKEQPLIVSGEIVPINTRVDEESGVKTLFNLFSRDISMAIPINTNIIPIATEMAKGLLNKASGRTPGNYFSALRLVCCARPVDAAMLRRVRLVPTTLTVVDNSTARCYNLPILTPFGAPVEHPECRTCQHHIKSIRPEYEGDRPAVTCLFTRPGPTAAE